jgi:hypothetical protein
MGDITTISSFNPEKKSKSKALYKKRALGRLWSGITNQMLNKNETNIPMPPKRGILVVCSFRLLGLSYNPKSLAIVMIEGIAKTLMMKEEAKISTMFIIRFCSKWLLKTIPN